MIHSPKISQNQPGLLAEKKIKCPACRELFTTHHFYPEGLEAEHLFSDGQTNISKITHPSPVIHCVFCGFVFSTENTTHETKHNHCTPPETFVNKPTNPLGKNIKLKDYLLFIRRGVASDIKEEFSVRKHFWWLLNNKIASEKTRDHCIEEIWRENMEKMLRIMEQDSIEAPLIQAEIFRNMEMFDLCIDALSNLPENKHILFREQLTKECLQKNPFRIRLTNNEGKLSSNMAG